MSLRIALAGNPNCGKTTLFNKLTGANQRVGNWPGVTVDRKEGKIKGTDDQLVDMPGIYSLSPYSPEEVVTRNYLIQEKPDAVINIVDATNLKRNLFLTLQVLDTGLPTVIALNMMDTIEKEGNSIDVGALSQKLGCPIVPISALKGKGVDELVKKTVEIANDKTTPTPIKFNDEIEEAIAAAETALRGRVDDDALRFSAVKLVELDEMVTSEQSEAAEKIAPALKKLEDAMDDSTDAVIADARYAMISDIVDGSVNIKPKGEKGTLSDRIDRIVTHRIWGLPIFIGIIGLLFFGIIGFAYGDFEVVGIGTLMTDYLNAFFGGDEELGFYGLVEYARDWCVSVGANDVLTSLLCDGIINGVGAVLGFLPQMLMMFLALCILEDIGYMARVAFVMDRIFRYFGLSGKSFIPVLVGIGCAVPGIMASRTIESERDRRITAMTVSFIPCSAKLPIIIMLSTAVFGGNGLVALFSYVLGIVVILISGIILKKWKSLSGEPAPFIMELPPYHMPSAFNIVKGTLDRGWAFVKRAGTIILLATIIIWFLSSFNTSLEFIEPGATTGSILSSIGEAICVVFYPLGWGDYWQLTVGTITGLVAKEAVIDTFAVLLGDDYELWFAGIGTAAALSFLAFNLLCAPCFAAMGAMHRELGTWKDTGIAIAYQCVIAYFIGTIIFVVAGYAYGETVPIYSTILAILFLGIIIYCLWAKDPFRQGYTEEA